MQWTCNLLGTKTPPIFSFQCLTCISQKFLIAWFEIWTRDRDDDTNPRVDDIISKININNGNFNIDFEGNTDNTNHLDEFGNIGNNACTDTSNRKYNSSISGIAPYSNQKSGWEVVPDIEPNVVNYLILFIVHPIAERYSFFLISLLKA